MKVSKLEHENVSAETRKQSDCRSLAAKENRRRKFHAMKVLVIQRRTASKMGLFAAKVSGPISVPVTPLAAKLANRPENDHASARKEFQLTMKNAAVVSFLNAKLVAANVKMSQNRGRTGRLANAKWRNQKDRDFENATAVMTLFLLLRLRLVHRASVCLK